MATTTQPLLKPLEVSRNVPERLESDSAPFYPTAYFGRVVTLLKRLPSEDAEECLQGLFVLSKQDEMESFLRWLEDWEATADVYDHKELSQALEANRHGPFEVILR